MSQECSASLAALQLDMLAVMARNPVRDGWRVLMRAPESILAEIAWRWGFGAAFWGLLIISFHQYFSQIEISRSEYAMMKSLEPFTWIAIAARLMQAFFAGTRAMGPILFPALALLWLAMATIGRAVTVRALAAEPSKTNWVSLVGLNAFRLVMTLAAFVAYCGAAVLVSTIFDPSVHYGLNVLLMLFVMCVLLLVWSVVNWFIGLSQIFAAHTAEGFARSIHRAMNLYHSHSGAFASSGLWFSLARLILLVLVTVGSLSPVANVTMAGVKPIAVFIAIITLIYFAAADALSMWRLGVYISLTEPEAVEPVSEPSPPPPAPIVEAEVLITQPVQPGEPPSAISEDWKPIAES
jgi:hypothetical protein